MERRGFLKAALGLLAGLIGLPVAKAAKVTQWQEGIIFHPNPSPEWAKVVDAPQDNARVLGEWEPLHKALTTPPDGARWLTFGLTREPVYDAAGQVFIGEKVTVTGTVSACGERKLDWLGKALNGSAPSGWKHGRVDVEQNLYVPDMKYRTTFHKV